MNFDLDADQIALRDAIRELCRGRAPLDRLRAAEGRLDRDLWRALGEAGVFSLRLPEERGGLGLGMIESVVVFEELGRALIPGPLVATHLAADWIDEAATGEHVVGFAQAHPGPVLVEHFSDLDRLYIDVGGLTPVILSETDAWPVARPLDPMTPLHGIAAVSAIAGVMYVPGMEPKQPQPERFWREGAVLTAALLVGIADRLTDLAVAYAKERKQFGRVIGSFQAVKHLCADMYTRTEVARAAVYSAGCILDDPAAGDADRAAAAAKLLAADAAVTNGKAAVQVYGGMGFTWEMDVHLYLKRAAVLATHFGSSDEKAEAVAACL